MDKRAPRTYETALHDGPICGVRSFQYSGTQLVCLLPRGHKDWHQQDGYRWRDVYLPTSTEMATESCDDCSVKAYTESTSGTPSGIFFDKILTELPVDGIRISIIRKNGQFQINTEVLNHASNTATAKYSVLFEGCVRRSKAQVLDYQVKRDLGECLQRLEEANPFVKVTRKSS